MGASNRTQEETLVNKRAEKTERVCVVLPARILAEIDALPLPRSTLIELLLEYALAAHFIPDLEEAKVFSDERPAQAAIKEEIAKRSNPKPQRKGVEVVEELGEPFPSKRGSLDGATKMVNTSKTDIGTTTILTDPTTTSEIEERVDLFAGIV